MRRASGFTLLETVVALAILALALMAIFDLNAGAVANHSYTKRLTVATMLARGKMIDLEQTLHDEGFSSDDDEESGDFSEEGWPQFKWRARILAPDLSGTSPQQLIGALFNLPTGGGGEDPLGGLASMLGGGEADENGQTTSAGAGMGALAGMAQGQMTQMVSQIAQTVREVHLTVSWKEGTQVESVDLVTHVVSLGRGSDRNSAASPAAQLPGGAAGAGATPQLPGQPARGGTR